MQFWHKPFFSNFLRSGGLLPLPKALQQLSKSRGSEVMPVADEAAYFFLRKLPDGVRGMRVPERLTGEVWVIGWCGRPCPAGANCLSTVDLCLRPVVVRRGRGQTSAISWRSQQTLTLTRELGVPGSATNPMNYTWVVLQNRSPLGSFL